MANLRGPITELKASNANDTREATKSIRDGFAAGIGELQKHTDAATQRLHEKIEAVAADPSAQAGRGMVHVV
jgi:hypothetical protein